MPSKKASSGAKSKASKALPIPEESSHVVFEDDKKKSKRKKPSDQPSQNGESSGPPKPTTKQIIGGASWTGKLPVNLLSEHCQRQKWNKPDYSMRQRPSPDGGDSKLYRSEVTLAKTDPKTREVIKLPTFRTPEALLAASEEPSVLEARHFAAAYALFRVSSMKNLSMALPPKYRDLWKDFTQIKKEDEKEGRSWLYDADPFAAEQKRQEIHLAMEKRKLEQEKKQEALAKNPVLALQQTPRGRQWDQAPKIEMGAKIRADVEKLVRASAIWNPYGLQLTKDERELIRKSLTSLTFRGAHVDEALEYCQNYEEALEWLLIHVPEDDLPAFALPANYSAGITLASGDIVLEAKLKRLAAAGYSRDHVVQALKSCDSDEHKAAFCLQNSLQPSTDGTLNDDIDSLVEWEGERAALESIYAEKAKFLGSLECAVQIDMGSGSMASVRCIIPAVGYPYELPAILISSPTIPAYIRLSATKQALQFAETNYKGMPMVYDLCEWLEGNIQNIIDNPTSLTDLRILDPEMRTSVESQETNSGHQVPLSSRTKRAYNNKRSDSAILDEFKAKQLSAEQQAMSDARRKLPAWGKMPELVQSIHDHQVTIITGETGSGKSTQVVQFILDRMIEDLKGSSTNIVCTQPRRLAAISLADRVSSERCGKVGDEVGYIIRGESKTSATTKITFMTTGVLLRRFQTSNSVEEALTGLTHIFIDEVHERSLDTDFLLSLLKSSIDAKPQLKIVLMSATVDKETFINYFGGSSRTAHVHIEGRTFPVTDHHLEDVLPILDLNLPTKDNELFNIGKAISSLGSGINYELITSMVAYIDQDLGSSPGSILIFLPGTFEIDRVIKALSSLNDILALPLHASLLPSEQRKVFPSAPKGKRKVIAATNVAETSITIEDVVAVIDTGKVKETRYDINNNIVRLEEVWTSQAAGKQRRGRAGRVREGDCYKLFTRTVEEKMSSKTLPEIQRVPLEQLCLSVKATDNSRDIATFLATLITPPEPGAVISALNLLHLIGALESNRLTALGTYLAMIPADLRCAKMLVYGSLFDCLEPCLSIASILTVKSPFVSPREKRGEADAAKATFDVSNGDLMLTLDAFEQFRSLPDTRCKQLQAWCSEKYLSLTTLRDIASTRVQLLDALKDANLVPATYKPSTTSASPQLLRAIISAALQPQIAEIKFPEKKYLQSMTGAKELDPEAKALKYFIPPTNEDTWSRVFIHPSSPLFHATPATLTSATYLSYFSKMATGAQPKTYIHSLTPLSTYSQLLFGSGGIKIDAKIPGGGLLVNDVFKIRGWARIGVLVSRLRRLLDQELKRAIDQPASADVFKNSEVIRVVRWLIELNGQDR